jgi:hypothetical protein
MRVESTIIERVLIFLRHPALAGSDGLMETILEHLESRACADQIRRARYGRLREMIQGSPHCALNH